MTIARRTFIAAAGVSPLLALRQGHALQATPDAGEPLPPGVLFEMLRDTPVTTPLFPSDLPEVTIAPWEDSNDTDLEGVVGGLLVQAGPNEEDLLGVYIVYPTFDLAEERFEATGSEGGATVEMLGRSWWSGYGELSDAEDGYSTIGVRDGLVVATAATFGPDRGANDLRALGIMAGLLDHLRLVSAPPST